MVSRLAGRERDSGFTVHQEIDQIEISGSIGIPRKFLHELERVFHLMSAQLWVLGHAEHGVGEARFVVGFEKGNEGIVEVIAVDRRVGNLGR